MENAPTKSIGLFEYFPCQNPAHGWTVGAPEEFMHGADIVIDPIKDN